MVKYYLFIIAAAMVLSGCTCLPDGTPPGGPIVEAPKIPQIYSISAAQNYMATALTTAFLQEFIPGKFVFLKAEFSSDDKKLKYMPNNTLKGMHDVFRVIFSESSKYRLISEISGVTDKSDIFQWEMKLFNGKDLLWKDSVNVNIAD